METDRDTTPKGIEEELERHTPTSHFKDYSSAGKVVCSMCEQTWPCPTVVYGQLIMQLRGEPIVELKKIVKALAEEMPTVHADEDMWHWCGICKRSLAMDGQPETHEDDCLYIAAWKWSKRFV